MLILWSVVMSACSSPCQEIAIQGVGRVIAASDGVPLAAYELKVRGSAEAHERPRAILFYVQGSEYASCLPAIERLAGGAVAGVRVIMMERRGIGFDGVVDQLAARAGSAKATRVADHRSVIDAFLRETPAGTPVLLVGASEGGDVACAIAAQDARVTHVVLIGSGGGWSQAEELRHMVDRDGNLFGIQGRDGLDAQFRTIRSRPDSLETWAGHPFRRWGSYLWSPPVDDLLRVKAPILLVHGAEDRNVPVESARALRDAFWARGRDNLTYREYAGLDHRLTDVATRKSAFPRFEVDLIDWFCQTGLLEKTEADAMKSRVRRAHPEAFTAESRTIKR